MHGRVRSQGSLRAARVCAAVLLLLAGVGCERGAPGDAPSPRADLPQRVISLNPSLTSMLIAIGADGLLVGVDSFSAQQQESVRALPQVGGLFDPNLEAVLSLTPDLVVLVPSVEQRGFRDRLAALDIAVGAYDPESYEEVAATLEALGQRVGRAGAAAARASEVRAMRAAVAAHTRDLPEATAVLVLQRDPLYVAGGGSFVDDMMRAAGVRNLGAELGDGWPSASREWLIAAAPKILVDTSRDPQPAAAFWRQWPSIPAVANGRVVTAVERDMTLPGPWLDRSLLYLLEALRPGERERFERAAGLPRTADGLPRTADGLPHSSDRRP